MVLASREIFTRWHGIVRPHVYPTEFTTIPAIGRRSLNFMRTLKQFFVCLGLLTGTAPVLAGDTVFTEDFADAANWLTGGFTALNEVASGGPDGSSYVSLDAAFNNIGQGTILRGHSGFGASGGAFASNWIDDEIIELSAFVRHNAPLPLNYFARLASPNNFPAAGVVSFVPVLPNTWTEITFNVLSNSPQIVTFEGSDYNTVFSNIGNVQLAVSVPDGFEMNPTNYTFDFDKVSIATVPEPTSLLLAGLGLIGVGGLRRRR